MLSPSGVTGSGVSLSRRTVHRRRCLPCPGVSTMGSRFGSSPSRERKEIRLPSGDHATSLTPLDILQTCLAVPPWTGKTCNCGLSFSPSPREIKARCWLSGDQRGQVSAFGPLVNGRASPPVVSTIQIRPRCLGLSGTHSQTTNAAHLPSGEMTVSVAWRISFKLVPGFTGTRGLSVVS